jgi:hypothetical protein
MTHFETSQKTLPESQIFQTSMDIDRTLSKSLSTEMILEFASTLAATALERLPEELSRTFGGSPASIHFRGFQIAQLPDESSRLTFSMELRKSSSPSSSNGYLPLSSGEVVGFPHMKRQPGLYTWKMGLLLN